MAKNVSARNAILTRSALKAAIKIVQNRINPPEPARPARTEKTTQPRITGPEGRAPDRRTIRSTQRAERELSGNARASTIADRLGISTQKWVAIRRKIRAGDLYGTGIRDKLREAIGGIEPVFVNVSYTVTGANGENIDTHSKAAYFPNERQFKEKVPQGKNIKQFAAFSDAVNWWGGIGGGAEYFAIVRTGSSKFPFAVADMRTKTEYSNKGKLSGEIRAQQILDGIDEIDQNEVESAIE